MKQYEDFAKKAEQTSERIEANAVVRIEDAQRKEEDSKR